MNVLGNAVKQRCAILMAAAAVCFASPLVAAESGELTIKTVAASVEPRQARSVWNGIVVAVQESSLTAQVPGRIDQIKVRAGEQVTANQELAVIDARESTAGMAQAQAILAQARAAKTGVAAAWERNKRLFDQGFISQASLDDSETQLAAANATVAQALAGVRRVSVASTYLSIRAPYDGLIAEVTAEVGEIAQPGRVLIRMLAPEALRVSLRVPTSYATGLSASSRAVVQPGGQFVRQASADQWSEPLPLRVMPSADPGSATVEVRIELPQALGAGLRPGQYLRVATFSPDGEGVFIPHSALLERGELKAVYVVSDNRFILRAVRVGPRAGEHVEILAGLSSGERIASDPVRAGLLGARPADRS